ncbi:tetraspanin-15 [Drosophila sechellia]|uniref:GM25432 n=1 Tax=Drosophila sechellia TaxID=7238 RepID=B4HH84_DROSE|nr:tetraspanin-15 [Drosophila sechellia]EDW41409.1 GM25432 [Drosophila sechellia]
MACCFNYKFVLNLCNFLFLICGLLLVVSGLYIFSDNKRILLSRLLAASSDRLSSLPQPLLFYIALGVAIAGFVATLAAVVGFWASCLHTYCFLTIYFLSVVVLLLTESVLCLAITLWPHCLGISLDETQMVRSLQSNYGVPGQEQFTNALDLAQVRFGCCGMRSSLDYDTSLWRLQGYGQRNWPVPLSCCVLQNADHSMAYLDPKPANESMCQSLERLSYERERHTESCLPHLDNWYREQYSVFLAASLILAMIEFCVLLAIIMSCTGLASQRARLKKPVQEMRTQKVKSRQTLIENIYEPDVELRENFNHSGDGIYLGPASRHVSSEDFKELYIKQRDLYKQHNLRTNPANRPTQMRNYLV